jgi:ubiquinone/menaquinone biosynthesis C-methylase UbiE
MESFVSNQDEALLYDSLYTKLKSDGKDSWSSEEDIAERFSFFSRTFPKSSVSKDILVLGCGDGAFSLLLGQKGFNVIGVDQSPKAIEWGISKLQNLKSNCSLQVQNVSNLSFQGETFDLVFDDFCLHCLVDDTRVKFYSESYRVLRSKGYLLLRSIIIEDITIPLDDSRRFQVNDGIKFRFFPTSEYICAEVKNAGFVIENKHITKDAYGCDILEMVILKK